MELAIEKRTATFYARLKPTNRTFIKTEARRLDVTESAVLDGYLDSIRGEKSAKNSRKTKRIKGSSKKARA